MTAPHERVAQRTAVGRFRQTPESTYDAASSAVATGSDTMTRYLAVQRFPGSLIDPGGSRQCFMSRLSSQNGWQVGARTTDATWEVDFGTTASGAFTRRVALPPPGRVGVLGFSYDSVDLLLRTDAGSTDSLAQNEAFDAGTAALVFGTRVGGDRPLLSFAILALLGSDAEVRSDAEMQTDLATLVDNLEQGRDLRTGLGHTPEFYWDARDAVIGGGGTRATWTDRIAGIDLTKNGSPESLSVPARTA